MNKHTRNLLSKIKGNYIKFIFIILSLLIVLTFTLVSCKKPPEPIRMFDMNSITDINYTTNSSRRDISVNESLITLSKANANDTESFMLLKNIIQTYETNVFNIAKKKEIFSNNLEIKNNDFVISFISISEGINQRSYELHISLSDMNGILKGPENTIELNENVISNLLNSNLIVTEIDYSSLPKVALTFNDEIFELKTNGIWNYLVYINRFQKESINIDIQNNSIQQNGEISVLPKLTFDSMIPNQLIVNIYNDNASRKLVLSDTLFPTENSIDLNLPTLNGNYVIEAICQWHKSPQSSFGEIIYSFEASVEALESYTLSKESYQPGDLIVLKGNYIDIDLNYTIESNLYNQGLVFQKSGPNYYMFLPIMSKADIGAYTISITDNDHPEQKSIINVDIIYKEFDVQYLETSGSTASLQNNDNYDQLNEAFARGRANLKEAKLWDGKFLQPIGGRISTEYGQIRYTNGSENSSRHSGIDFANPTGTEIIATQNGYVTLAEELNITGNTLFIDHGFGIVSQYYHTNCIYVTVGDYVTAGQPVAEVGTTGFSTGPHLHFSIYYNGIYLNPWKFFEEAPF